MALGAIWIYQHQSCIWIWLSLRCLEAHIVTTLLFSTCAILHGELMLKSFLFFLKKRCLLLAKFWILEFSLFSDSHAVLILPYFDRSLTEASDSIIQFHQLWAFSRLTLWEFFIFLLFSSSQTILKKYSGGNLIYSYSHWQAELYKSHVQLWSLPCGRNVKKKGYYT